MAWYGQDYGRSDRSFRYDNRNFGFGGRAMGYGSDYDRTRPMGGTGWGQGSAPRRSVWESSWVYDDDRGDQGTGYRAGGGNFGGGNQYGGQFGGGYGDRERMTFRPNHYDRDLGDRVQEGWNDMKQGMRRAFGGGHTRHGGTHGGYGGISGGGYSGGQGGFGGQGGYDRGFGGGYSQNRYDRFWR